MNDSNVVIEDMANPSVPYIYEATPQPPVNPYKTSNQHFL